MPGRRSNPFRIGGVSAAPRKQKGVRGAGYDEEAAERVRRILSGRRDVVEKRMVGGLSFMVKGSMCCGVTGTALMVRVGREARERVLAEPNVRPMEFAGRPLAGFVCVDPGGFGTDAALAAWVRRGIDFVSTLPAKSPRHRNGSERERD
jgi:TfoX N-terminal domain